jgi:reductive dehalogenase
MIFKTRNESRYYHLGPFPFETLARDSKKIAEESDRPRIKSPLFRTTSSKYGAANKLYYELFTELRTPTAVSHKAPVPDDLERRAIDIKGMGYFLDAAHVGICTIPENAWFENINKTAHKFAIVIAIEHGRIPEEDNLAYSWVKGCGPETATMRGMEIAACMAIYICQLGYKAHAHAIGTSDVDLERLAVLAGIASRHGDEVLSPYLDDNVSFAAITTDYALPTDKPLKPIRHANKGLRYWLGINGAESGAERNRQSRRQSHASRYPMEKVRCVDRPTTLILDDEVPRVPKRAAFFERALKGDLGEKTRKERLRFAYKHPLSFGMLEPIHAMQPLQDGPVSVNSSTDFSDPVANTKAIKSLSYFLGADLTGICEIPDYAWFSHHADGEPIETYNKYAIVMLIDQGFETMEGASGDDWISGCQSMRGYLRGAEIAGIMAELLRAEGVSARAQTNIDSDVLQIPLILLAGLGELSRIGELVLNPYVGPRFKSVVLTTDLPLEVDKPIDFGLQYFCSNCLKCARECPCDAIPVTNKKVMFNGYEIWKPDVERCVRYRVTNQKGSSCGRCMKTCPLNKVVTADGPLAHKIGTWLGVNAMWLKPVIVPIAVWLDDKLGYGMRNLKKKWWLDLEVVDGVTVKPEATNQRDIDVNHPMNLSREKIAYHHANMMPPPDADKAIPVDRKAAKESAAIIETPAEALARRVKGGSTPAHYIPIKYAPEQNETNS